MKTEINKKLWSMFVYHHEYVKNCTQERNIKITSHLHPYHPIVFIRATLNVTPEELAKLNNHKVFEDGSLGYEYAVYRKSLTDVEQGLSSIEELIYEKGDMTAAAQGFNAVIATPLSDDKGNTSFTKKKPLGFIPAYPYFVNRVIYFPSEEEVKLITDTVAFKKVTDQPLINKVINDLSKILKPIPGAVKNIAAITTQWEHATERPKLEELYLTLNYDKSARNVNLGFDIAPAISNDSEQLVIDNTVLNPEDWFEPLQKNWWVKVLDNRDEDGIYVLKGHDQFEPLIQNIDHIYLVRLFSSLNIINKALKEYNDFYDGFRGIEGNFIITKIIEEIFINNVRSQFIRSLRCVWRFSDTSEQGRALVEEEVSKIINGLAELSETKGRRVYLDLNNILLHYRENEAIGSEELPEEEQFVKKMFGCYMVSFGEAVQTKLLRTESVYFKPLIKKDGEVKTLEGAVLNAEDLLAQENQIRQ